MAEFLVLSRILEIVTLSEAADVAEDLIGGKAAKLARLMRAGFAVPGGFCITTDAFRRMLLRVPSLDERLERLSRLQPDDREAILAALDSVLDAARSELEGYYSNTVFVTGVISNMFMAGLLTFLGDRLGVELYFAAIVAFGVRMFNNLAVIRRLLLERGRSQWQRGH